MSISLTVNGVSFNYPQNNDQNWGIDATNWAQAVTSGMLQKAGGSFPLTSLVDFGNAFGMKVLNITSETANPATAGYVRLAKTDAIEFRNNANSANLPLAIDGSDNLTFNGIVVGTAASVTNIFGTANQIIASSPNGNVTLSTPQNINLTSSPTFVGLTLSGLSTGILHTAGAAITSSLIVNADITNATIDLTSKVTNVLPNSNTTATSANTASTIVTRDGSGNFSAGTITASLTGHASLDLALTGGTMSGAIAMGSNKITGVATGTAPTDAANVGQITATFVAPNVQFLTSGSGTYTTPASTLYLRIRMVGGGGGGAGGSDATQNGGDGGTGGVTTFGTSLLVANGGHGGTHNTSSGTARGGAGGTASLGGAIGFAFSGGSGASAGISGAGGTASAGGSGAASPFGGAGGDGPIVGAGVAGASAIPNTGSGGAGGGSAGPGDAGGGGGAGGYVEAFISSPSATYSYAIGAAGTAGAAGTGAFGGGAGGSGFAVIEAHFQ